MSSIRNHIDALIANGVEFQVGIRGTGQPIGPGKVEQVENPPHALDGLYRMLVPAAMQADKNSRPKNVFLPLVFDVSDVVLVIEAPVNRDGESAILTPNGKTAGGLHIPGS